MVSAYDQSALATGEGLYFNAPYYVFNLYYSFAQYPLSLSDPFPKNYPLNLPSTATAFQRDLRTAYTQQWSFAVQQEVGRNQVVELAYVGSKGTKLIGARDLNQPLPGTQQPNLRPVPQFDDINVIESRGEFESIRVFRPAGVGRCAPVSRRTRHIHGRNPSTTPRASSAAPGIRITPRTVVTSTWSADCRASMCGTDSPWATGTICRSARGGCAVDGRPSVSGHSRVDGRLR